MKLSSGFRKDTLVVEFLSDMQEGNLILKDRVNVRDEGADEEKECLSKYSRVNHTVL